MTAPPRDLADASARIAALETENARLLDMLNRANAAEAKSHARAEHFADSFRRVIRELEHDGRNADGRFYAGWLRRIVEKGTRS